MIQTRRLGLAVLTGFSTFFLFIFILIIWNGWFLPEPQYIVYSYDEIVKKEVMLSLINLLIDIVILFLPIYITALFFKRLQRTFTLKRFSAILILVIVLSSLIVVRTISESLSLWQPLEQSTHNIEQRTFSRGRGGGLGLQKVYAVRFTTKTSNLSFIKNGIIPTLERFGYEVNDYGATIGRQDYTSVSDHMSTDIQVQSINNIPFTAPLADLDFAGINFRKKRSLNSIDLVTGNYRGDDIVKGYLQSYY